MTRSLILALALSACPSTPTEPEVAALDLDSPDGCAACHSAVVEEWRGSMHAAAHHEKDPIYGALRSLRMERQGEQIGKKCASCHHPRSTEDLESDVAKQGVSCATCHNLDGVKRQEGAHGAEALIWAKEGVVRGPHGYDGPGPPHPIGEPAPWLTDGQTLCLACHDAAENPHGVATCTTGAEYARAESPQSCTSCHMPEVQGPSGVISQRTTHRSHAFLGPHSLWSGGDPAFMAQAVDIEGNLTGADLTITLVNQTSHGFPSGFPGRVALVKVIGLDAEGKEVWTNFTTDPMAQDPQAVLNKVYANDDGEPVMPPFATQLTRDNRLKPDERRELRWSELPSEVHQVRVSLLFRLLPPPAVTALGLAESPLGQPRPMKSTTIVRSEG